jgi:hypothetical protein
MKHQSTFVRTQVATLALANFFSLGVILTFCSTANARQA